jgi:hypothetical protein
MTNDKKTEDVNQSSSYSPSVVSRAQAVGVILGLSIMYVLLFFVRIMPGLFSTYPLTNRRFREERFLKGALVAISVGAFLAILGQSSLDKSLYITLLLLSIAIPALSISIYSEFFLHSLSYDTSVPKGRSIYWPNW